MNANATRLVDYRARDGVALIELSNPPMNCFTFEMMHELDEAILRARFDDGVHALVLRGAGDSVFCAGGDIRLLHAVTPGFRYAFLLHAAETLDRLAQTPKLVIAALNGHTVGGGLEIALAADLRIARQGAGRIGLPEIKLGIMPGIGGTHRLTQLVGPSRAIELMIGGELMGFDDAQALGLVNQVWETANTGDFMEKVVRYAAGFGPPEKAALAVGAIKRVVRTGADLSAEGAQALERELERLLFASGDASEGHEAWLAKRKPTFLGR
ncbi:MAG TPA: enoyl-CoA hydratase/isomerase family protein [Terriglobales bacterium]|nr:enoyl-CoA hydratase/isomerase family protein [Terriglobales bacterium]